MNFTFAPAEHKKGSAITIFVDNPDAWIIPWAKVLLDIIGPHHDVDFCTSKADLKGGDMAFLLGCTKKLEQEYLDRYTINFVVHESDLPKGRGWSPVSWQVLEGVNSIPVALFEVCEEIDAGPVFLRDFIELDGTELLPEIKEKQGRKTVEMVLAFLEQWPDIEPEVQVGEPTFYGRRGKESDRLDVNATIAEQFDHLRIIDNEKYPGWFEMRGQKYIVKIYEME